MTGELFWLAVTTTMTALLWLPYITNWIMEKGLIASLWNPTEYDHNQAKAAWARRMLKAHENAAENLAVFAPLVLILHTLGISTPATVTACIVYFAARLIHVVVFTLAVPALRVISFLTGFGAQMVLAWTILGAL
ncbi:MAG: MAPEG family protein [Gammaproteobacteria bacterium]|nr:MAPEG family protein [Gammaproteobacteria bacterium]